ncbi:hypothetical protein CO180_02580 [candidate division WWE3 bacterium CG_4_9_14_3_um_filter_41_6]|uniref:PIN domain-containing protein n=1 Tax=candidate division WWE3 bacterium CG_4_10_14_0_2_um_filter_41_14 TaxID=1975072 RepID=A0A2M7TJ49_UNCKA|nr:MAG: hypothetical protein COY32_03205 [candidate division WWE3 bacterium CG_4_10_14_0_2_um_filter_41_14]PJA38768.1 MAG: hypothetical protein CO180_02580 [candidate division WWE3 bacterium CG_4_9_14_3_um_filter_41_6]
MNTLFINTDAFSALNIYDHPHHGKAIAFVNDLFSQTVKLYTSHAVVTHVAEKIRRKQGYPKMLQFINLIQTGGFSVLYEDEVVFERASKRLLENKTVAKMRLVDAIVVEHMMMWGVKDVFTFRQEFKKCNVITWPK